jgi:hypothetical protein
MKQHILEALDVLLSMPEFQETIPEKEQFAVPAVD